MYINVLLLPLLSFILCGLIGRKIGYNGVKISSSSLIFLTFIISLFIFKEVIINKSIVYIDLWYWFNIGILNNKMQLRFDMVVSSMLILVSLVSFCVHLYSTSYMDGDPHLPRFLSYLSLFTFFMLILVTSNNLIQLFIGWEGVGLCSYLLISFWFTRIQANKSAIKAMIINKIGDMGLLLGIILIWSLIGGLDYNTIFCGLFQINNILLLEISSLFLLIGVIGKSAQIGLHTWLPDAMEGPTPVSALIHAATMVTAGVFLIIRMSPLFENTPTTLLIITLIGSLTAFFSATIGLTQNDLKKVIAYSTCSQLGYMVMICGFSHYNISLFHLINHGFFKALLFLSAGSIIHSLNDEQDLRKMGSLYFINSFSYICIFIGSISLMGLPFLTGFYSKDLILELINSEYYLSYSFWLGIIAASLTAFYSFRLVYFTFYNYYQGPILIIKNSKEGKWNLSLPLFILLVFSIIIGYTFQFFIISDDFPVMVVNFNKWLPFLVSLAGSLLSIFLGYKLLLWWKYSVRKISMIIYTFLNGSWYFDNLINTYISEPFMKLGFNVSYKLIDNQILEKLGPTGFLNLTKDKSNNLSYFHMGKINIYILFIILFVFCILLKI